MHVLKNPKHEKFAQALAQGRTFSEACISSDLWLWPCQKPASYYVYILVNPLDCKVFYIGKGIENRFKNHTNECRRGEIVNVRKHTTIEAILAANKLPVAYCLTDGLTEGDAYELEGLMIKAVGPGILTNIDASNETSMAVIEAGAAFDLKNMVSFEKWAENPRTIEAINSYFQIVKVYKLLAMVSGKLRAEFGAARCLS